MCFKKVKYICKYNSKQRIRRVSVFCLECNQSPNFAGDLNNSQYNSKLQIKKMFQATHSLHHLANLPWKVKKGNERSKQNLTNRNSIEQELAKTVQLKTENNY